MSIHFTKAVEHLLAAYNHTVIGLAFELKHTDSVMGLDGIMELMGNLMCDVKATKQRYTAIIKENKLEGEFNDITNNLIAMRKEAYAKRNGK